MTLTEYLALDIWPSGISSADKFLYIQQGYEDVVRKLRLDPSIHPVHFQNHIKLDNFAYMGEIVSSASEFAVKEIQSLNTADLMELDMELGTVGTCTVGNIESTDYDLTNFSTFNNTHATIPQVYMSGPSIACSNVDDCFVLMACYMYPYLVYTDNDIYTDQHLYNVSDMNDLHGGTSLTVDPALGVLTLYSALAQYFGDNGMLNEESVFHKFYIDIINYYNTQKESLKADNLDYMGDLDGSVGLS